MWVAFLWCPGIIAGAFYHNCNDDHNNSDDNASCYNGEYLNGDI